MLSIVQPLSPPFCPSLLCSGTGQTKANQAATGRDPEDGHAALLTSNSLSPARDRHSLFVAMMGVLLFVTSVTQFSLGATLKPYVSKAHLCRRGVGNNFCCSNRPSFIADTLDLFLCAPPFLPGVHDERLEPFSGSELFAGTGTWRSADIAVHYPVWPTSTASGFGDVHRRTHAPPPFIHKYPKKTTGHPSPGSQLHGEPLPARRKSHAGISVLRRRRQLCHDVPVRGEGAPGLSGDHRDHRLVGPLPADSPLRHPRPTDR